MMVSFRLALCLGLGTLAQGAATAQEQAGMALLAAQDIRLARVAERMLGANDALCRQHMPLTGLILQTRDQFRTDLGGAFANGPVTIAQVVAGSPAAGQVEAGDGLVAIASTRTDTVTRVGAAPLRDAVFDVLAGQPADRDVTLTIRRAGTDRTVFLPPRSGCRALVEVRSVQSRNARSDGRVIQVDYGLASAVEDDALAAVFAHEFAHLVLEHRRRLDQAGVSKGFFGEFGKNQRLNREVEVEADRLSVHLLANAGYDPRVAPALWRSRFGRAIGGLTAVYPSPEDRARLLEREIANYLPGGIAPTWPGHLLARRDQAG